MKATTDNYAGREQAIAALLWYGTWFASAVIAAGMVLGSIEPFGGFLGFGLNGHDITKAGVALFILLPIARVALMLVIFLRERDYVYTVISGLVLIIIAAGIIIGLVY